MASQNLKSSHQRQNQHQNQHKIADTQPDQKMQEDKPPLVANANVDGWEINLPTPEHALYALTEAALAGESYSCVTLNLDHLVKLRADSAFKKAYQSARFVTADGAPIAAIARRHSPEFVRTTGADLMLPLCQKAARYNIPIYLFGTSDEVLEKTAAQLKRFTNGKLIIAGMTSPQQGFDVESADADMALQDIKASGARLCFVLLGAPKQELFAAKAVAQGIECGFICVGAAADFIAGQQVRAPQFLQSIGMEWFWRLAHNPRRLGMRYFQCALVFARIGAQELLQSARHLIKRHLITRR